MLQIRFLFIYIGILPRIGGFIAKLRPYHRNGAAFSKAKTSKMTFTSRFCQLLGLNSASPTQFSIHWPGFCERGGKTDIHADGWGLAYYQETSLRQFHDTQAASESALAKFLENQSIESSNILAHIRYATHGRVDLANVHPFSREMWGIQWSFAHNGEIPMFCDHPCHWPGDFEGEYIYHAIGQTDSERFFCALLNSLRAEYTDNMPSLPRLYDSIRNICQQAVNYDKEATILNFMLTCGPHALWVYSWPGSRPGSKVWNGLHYKISDQDTSLNTGSVQLDASGTNRVAIVATKPMSNDEEWIELQRGELLVIDEGIPYTQARDLFHVELQGRGLGSNALEPPTLKEDMRHYSFDPSFYSAQSI